MKDALAAGVLHLSQAATILEAVKALPVQRRAEGEATLVAHAATLAPDQLRQAGARIHHWVDPEGARKKTEQKRRRDEVNTHRDRGFQLVDDDHGGTTLTGYLPQADAAIVRAGLAPLWAPRTAAPPTQADSDFWRIPGGDRNDTRTPTQRRADGLVDIFRLALATTKLPRNGGDRPQVVLTMRLDDLRAGVGAATLDDGTELSAEQARRLACDCQLIPAVLNTRGQILDLGRQRRLVTGALRRAMLLRDGGCCHPGCDRPPRWTEGHHIVPWHQGGATRLDNIASLCGAHHRLVHQGDWQVRINPDTKLPEFIPPAYLDPQRKPIHNTLHSRQ